MKKLMVTHVQIYINKIFTATVRNSYPAIYDIQMFNPFLLEELIPGVAINTILHYFLAPDQFLIL